MGQLELRPLRRRPWFWRKYAHRLELLVLERNLEIEDLRAKLDRAQGEQQHRRVPEVRIGA